MKNKMMLKATKHNWGLTRVGDWKTVTWVINYNMSYSITKTLIPEFDPKCDGEQNGIPTPVCNTLTGQMKPEAFANLIKILETKPWRTSGLEIHACDGVAWKIDYFSSDGELIQSSGKPDYIYGEKHLLKIAKTLPQA